MAGGGWDADPFFLQKALYNYREYPTGVWLLNHYDSIADFEETLGIFTSKDKAKVELGNDYHWEIDNSELEYDEITFSEDGMQRFTLEYWKLDEIFGGIE